MPRSQATRPATTRTSVITRRAQVVKRRPSRRRPQFRPAMSSRRSARQRRSRGTNVRETPSHAHTPARSHARLRVRGCPFFVRDPGSMTLPWMPFSRVAASCQNPIQPRISRTIRNSPRLDAIGRDLPSLLEDGGFRDFVRGLTLPAWPDRPVYAGAVAVPAPLLHSPRVSGVGLHQSGAAAAGIDVAEEHRRPTCERVQAAEPAADSELRRLRALQLEALSTRTVRSRSAISTRFRTSCTCTTSTGSSSCTSRSRPLAARIFAAIDRMKPALAAGRRGARSTLAWPKSLRPSGSRSR